MGWFWNPFQGGNGKSEVTNRLTKRTSAKIQEFDNGTKRNGSLVLESEDLRVIKVQSQIEGTRRKIQRNQRQFDDETNVLRRKKDGLSAAVADSLNEAQDDSVYQAVVQSVFSQDEFTMAPPGDGVQEARVLKQIHIAELGDKIRGMFQQQSSDNMMEVYGVSSQLKERMGEREAQYLSMVVKRDTLVQEKRNLNENILSIQKKMIAKLQQGAQDHFQQQYDALRTGEYTVGKRQLASPHEASHRLLEQQSYSSRLLGTESTAKVHKKAFLHDLAFDEEQTSNETSDLSKSQERSSVPTVPSQPQIEDASEAMELVAKGETKENKEGGKESGSSSNSQRPRRPIGIRPAGSTASKASGNNGEVRRTRAVPSATGTSRDRSRSGRGMQRHTEAMSWQRNPSQRNLNQDKAAPDIKNAEPKTAARSGPPMRSTAASRAAAASAAARRAAAARSNGRPTTAARVGTTRRAVSPNRSPTRRAQNTN